MKNEDIMAKEKGIGRSTSMEKITSIADHNESVTPPDLKKYVVTIT